jgi:hypothetical protein
MTALSCFIGIFYISWYEASAKDEGQGMWWIQRRPAPGGASKSGFNPKFMPRPSILSNFDNLNSKTLRGFRNMLYVIGVRRSRPFLAFPFFLIEI